MMAARCPPRSEPQNSQALRPSGMQRSARSAALLMRQMRPSSKIPWRACGKKLVRGNGILKTLLHVVSQGQLFQRIVCRRYHGFCGYPAFCPNPSGALQNRLLQSRQKSSIYKGFIVLVGRLPHICVAHCDPHSHARREHRRPSELRTPALVMLTETRLPA